jgi:hypothetical protein
LSFAGWEVVGFICHGCPASPLQETINQALDRDSNDGKILFSISQRFLAFRAEIFKLGMTIGKRIALDDTSIA